MTTIPRRTRFDTGPYPDTGSPHAEDERQLSEIVMDLSTHAQQLVRAEIDLAKDELTTKMKAMAVYVGLAVGAAIITAASLIFLGHTIAQALNVAMPEWAAYLITYVLLMAVAVGMALAAKQGFEKTSVAPTESIEHAKEDLTWVKQHR